MPATLYDPAGRPAAGKVSLWWVPAIANINAPTVIEMTAGTNITNVVYAFSDGATQNTVDRRKYGYANVMKSFGRATFEPAALEYDDSPQTAGVGYEYLAVLVEGAVGFIVHRRDIDISVAPAAAQKVDVRAASLGYQARVDVGDTEGEMFRIRQAIIYTGARKDNAVLA